MFLSISKYLVEFFRGNPADFQFWLHHIERRVYPCGKHSLRQGCLRISDFRCSEAFPHKTAPRLQRKYRPEADQQSPAPLQGRHRRAPAPLEFHEDRASRQGGSSGCSRPSRPKPLHQVYSAGYMDHLFYTGDIPAAVNPQDSGGVFGTCFWGKHQRRDGIAGGRNPNCGDGNIFVGPHRSHGNQLLFGQHIILGRTFQMLFSEFYAVGRRKLCLASDRQPLVSAVVCGGWCFHQWRLCCLACKVVV